MHSLGVKVIGVIGLQGEEDGLAGGLHPVEGVQCEGIHLPVVTVSCTPGAQCSCQRR